MNVGGGLTVYKEGGRQHVIFLSFFEAGTDNIKIGGTCSKL